MTNRRYGWAALLGAGLGLLTAPALYRAVRRGMPLRGRVLVITGGSRGFGLVLARECARQGARLALVARDADDLDRAREELTRDGAEVMTFACDVATPGAAEELVAAVMACFGRIDVLVNNAGTIEVGPMAEMTLDDYQRAMDTHFFGPLRMVEAVLPVLRAAASGRIVNIASIGGLLAIPHLLPYSASKSALVGYSEGLRAELAREGIVVTTVCPGLMRTGSARNADFKGRHRAEYAWFRLGDALPGLSMDARRAARRVVHALRTGEAHVVLGLPAKLAAVAHGIAPGLVGDVMRGANALLPAPGGIGAEKAKGYESRSALSESVLTTLDQHAARANHET